MKLTLTIRDILTTAICLCLFCVHTIAQSPEQLISDHLNGIADDVGLKSGDVEDFEVSSHHESSTSGIHHYYFIQNHEGVNIWRSNSSLHMLDNKVLKYHNSFFKDLEGHQIDSKAPSISAIDIVTEISDQMDYGLSGFPVIIQEKGGPDKEMLLSKENISLEDIEVRMIYYPVLSAQDGFSTYSLKLCWEAIIYEMNETNVYQFLVDANTGEIYEKINWVVQCDHGSHEEHSCVAECPEEACSITQNRNHSTWDPASELIEEAVMAGGYRVFPLPVETPGHGSRTLENDPDDPTASPFGWHDTDGSPGAEFTITRGNNTHSYEDGDNAGFSPDGGAGLIFDFPFNPVYSGGDQSESAAITNLFYWNNICHDLLYYYGFDEASGNFQVNNYGKGGVGNDDVRSEAQDASGTCNANMLTPPEGSRPRMQMYVCGSRDGDFDNAVIVHEYIHGLTNRLTGGPANVSCLNNDEQMGEGWSDWYALMFTMEAGDMGPDARGIGTWLFNQGPNGPGIRTYPYSTDLSVNPHTYDDIKTENVPHGVGSVWSAMLWELTWGLIEQYGFDHDYYNGSGGNNIALELVTEALKLQPCSPGFVDGRDALLAADQALYNGVNECIIWEAFAKRGLGYSANQGSSFSRSDGTEAFDLPPVCEAAQGTQMCFDFTGSITDVVVPDGVDSVTITAKGAQGASNMDFCGVQGGLGAEITGKFAVTPGQTLRLLVGEQGETDISLGDGGGGGGGSFVWDASTNSLLIAAGGGGGASGCAGSEAPGGPGSATMAPTPGGAAGSGPGGSGGNGGQGGINTGGSPAFPGSGGGGTGWNSNGMNGSVGSAGFGGQTPLSGGNGGLQGTGDSAGRGGFGGGGGHGGNDGAGGGGGGYNGGGGGNNWNGSAWGSGGGGGSFNAGDNQVNVTGVQSGNGQICLTFEQGVIKECAADTTIDCSSDTSVAALGAPVCEGLTLYGTDGFTSALVTIDINTGTSTTVGIMPGLSNGIGIAYNPNTEDAFVRDFDELFMVDLMTGSTSLVGPSGSFITSLTYDFNYTTLYSVNQSTMDFYEVDPATGAATMVGNTGISVPLCLATDAIGVIWAVDINANIYTINPNTGVGTLQFPTVHPNGATAIAIHPNNGFMYLVTLSGDLLVEVDLSNGNASTIGGPLNIADCRGLAFVDCRPCPNLTHTDSIIPGRCANEYTIERTFSTFEAEGPVITCVQNINVIDTTPPIVCTPMPLPMDTTIDCTMEMIPVDTITGIDECDSSMRGQVWINEIHYDNFGVDRMEFVELAGFNSTNLQGWRLVLYNGTSSRRSVYNDMMLT
ncbi:MAG: M36 family metallopeptidase, partial [Saprospiraceae bacterium]|nr:M36 family metallopeptidase [Saprospiraceae bacterium]